MAGGNYAGVGCATQGGRRSSSSADAGGGGRAVRTTTPAAGNRTPLVDRSEGTSCGCRLISSPMPPLPLPLRRPPDGEAPDDHAHTRTRAPVYAKEENAPAGEHRRAQRPRKAHVDDRHRVVLQVVGVSLRAARGGAGRVRGSRDVAPGAVGALGDRGLPPPGTRQPKISKNIDALQ
mgnify:CR=1 FL=1